MKARDFDQSCFVRCQYPLFVASILPVTGREAEPKEPIEQETSRAREAGQLGEAWSWFTGSA